MFSRKKKIQKSLSAVIVIFFIAFLSEISIFNLKHWTTRFIGPVFDARAFDFDIRENTDNDGEFVILNIDKNIRTLFLSPIFAHTGITAVYIDIRWRDENNETTYTAQVLNGYEPSFYIPLGAMGKVKNVTVTFNNKQVDIQNVTFNKPLPMRIFISRILLLTFILSLAYFWKKEQFGDLIFNPDSVGQKAADVCLLSVFIGILFLIMIVLSNWSADKTYSGLVDAFLAKRLYLDIEPDESLLNAAEPYSFSYRTENSVKAPWDLVFYNRKIYAYFGIVPALILHLPHYLLFKNYLSAIISVFIFSVMGAIGLYLLWKEIAKKYFRNLPYEIYSVCLAALLFGSNLMVLIVRANVYEIPIAGAFMFSVWGLYFILLAASGDLRKNIMVKHLFSGGACLALAVGCRPTALFVSLIVPFFLLPALHFNKIISDKSTRKTIAINAASLAVPYIAVGCALMWYNYARFDSVFEFGPTYQIGISNTAALTQSGVLGNLRCGFDGIFAFLFSAFRLEPYFPFIYAAETQSVFTGFMGKDKTIGLFMLPITWFLPAAVFAAKSDSIKRAFHIIAPMTATGLIIIIISSVMMGVTGRYTIDFFWLFLFPAVICAAILHEEALKIHVSCAKTVRRLIFAAAGITIFIMTGWGTVGEENLIWVRNPVAFRFLSDFFSII